MQWTFGTIAILAKENDNFADWRRIRTRLFGAHSPGIDFGASDDDISLQSLAYSTFHLQGLRSVEGSQLAHEDLSSKWGARTLALPLFISFRCLPGFSRQSRGPCSLRTKSAVLLLRLRLLCRPARLVRRGPRLHRPRFFVAPEPQVHRSFGAPQALARRRRRFPSSIALFVVRQSPDRTGWRAFSRDIRLNWCVLFEFDG